MPSTTTARRMRAGRSSPLFVGIAVTAVAAVLLATGALTGGGPSTIAPAPVGTGFGPTTGGADGVARRLSALQARVKAAPADYTAWASLGLAYVERAKVSADPAFYPKAQGAAERSLSINTSDNFAAYAALAALALSRHDFAGARDLAQAGLAVNPANAMLYGALGDAHTQLGNYGEAFDAIQRMADISPDTSSLARVSYTWELRGDTAQATAYMQRALDDATSNADRAFARYYLGELALSAGDAAGALRHYEAGLRTDPSYTRLLEGKAKAHAALGRTDEAVEEYRQAVERLPEPAFLLQFGELLQSLGRTAEADEQYRLFTTVADLFTRNGAALDVEAALFHADHGDAAEALRVAEAGIRNRAFVDMADAYAWALHVNNRHAEALVWSDKARALGGRNASFSFHGGMIKLALGDRDGGRADLRLALDTNPHFSPLWAPVARQVLDAQVLDA